MDLVLLSGNDSGTAESRVAVEINTAVGNGGDAVSANTILVDEDVSDIVGTLLRESHVALGGTGLLVSITVDNILGVSLASVDDISDGLQVSSLGIGQSSLANLEVNSLSTLISGNALVGESLGELILEVGILSTEFAIFVSELVGLLVSSVLCSLCSGSGSLSGGDSSGITCDGGGLAGPVGLAKVESEATESGTVHDSTRLTIVVVSLSGDGAQVEGQIDAVAKAEFVEETSTGGEVIAVGLEETCCEIRNQVVEPLLLVAPELVGNIPQEVTVDVREVILYIVGLAVDTLPTGTDTEARIDPFAKISIDCEGSFANLCVSTAPETVNGDVDTTANTYEPIVKELIGLVSTILDFSILIPIGLLCESGTAGEDGNCKN